MTETTKLTLPLEDALYLARAIMPAVSKDDVTPILTGQMWTVTPEKITAVATDRYRVHRAAIEGDFGKASGAFLIPRKSLEWLVKNATHFGRRSQFLVDPQLTIEFEVTEPAVPNKLTDSTPMPAGFVSLSIAENESTDAQTLTLRSALIKGLFPPVADLIDSALEADSSDPGVVNLEFVGGTRALASDRMEGGRVRFVKNSKVNGKGGQMLVQFRRGIALIQQQND